MSKLMKCRVCPSENCLSISRDFFNAVSKLLQFFESYLWMLMSKNYSFILDKVVTIEKLQDVNKLLFSVCLLRIYDNLSIYILLLLSFLDIIYILNINLY